MGTCQIKCRTDSRELEVQIGMDSNSEPMLSKVPYQMSESIASEQQSNDAPEFVVSKHINTTERPHSNRFIEDLEGEVKRRIREIQLEEMREKQAFLESIERAQRFAEMQAKEVSSRVSPSTKEETTMNSRGDVQNNDSTEKNSSPDNAKSLDSKNQIHPAIQEAPKEDSDPPSNEILPEVAPPTPPIGPYGQYAKGAQKNSDQASQGSDQSSPVVKAPVRRAAYEKLISEYLFYDSKGRENRFQRQSINDSGRKGILKYATFSVRQILLSRSASSKTSRTVKTANSKKVRFSKDTNFNNKRKGSNRRNTLFSLI